MYNEIKSVKSLRPYLKHFTVGGHRSTRRDNCRKKKTSLQSKLVITIFGEMSAYRKISRTLTTVESLSAHAKTRRKREMLLSGWEYVWINHAINKQAMTDWNQTIVCCLYKADHDPHQLIIFPEIMASTPLPRRNVAFDCPQDSPLTILLQLFHGIRSTPDAELVAASVLLLVREFLSPYRFNALADFSPWLWNQYGSGAFHDCDATGRTLRRRILEDTI